MSFQKKLNQIIKKNNSLVCVGLDSNIDKLPQHLTRNRYPQFTFNQAIIRTTHDLVCAYKLNSAFYEATGHQGIKQLQLTCKYLQNKHPNIPIILDAKRADIGSTNEGYLDFAFSYLKADAITLHPYLGQEALKPFLKQKNKGIIILCRTSNPKAGEFQDLKTNHQPLWQTVAKNVVTKWNKNKNCALVVGATYPKELKVVRQIAPHIIFLIPGIGAQGGNIKKTVTAAKTGPFIINSSRSIIFALSGKNFAQAAKVETQKLKNTINKYR